MIFAVLSPTLAFTATLLAFVLQAISESVGKNPVVEFDNSLVPNFPNYYGGLRVDGTIPKRWFIWTPI